MEMVKNDNGKTVCYADAKAKTVEIVQRGYTTIIRFFAEDQFEVINLPKGK